MATTQQLEREFLRAARGISDAARFNALREAIRRGDIESAMAAVDIENSAFDGLRVMITQTYAEGGVNAVNGTKWPVVTRWNSATPQAESFARNTVGQNITYITEDMRAGVRETIGDGLAFGRSPNRIALDIVGRIGKSGRREGGIVGLNQQQAAWVRGYRQKLESGAPVGNTLVTGAERKVIEAGSLTQAQIDRLVQSYSNRMLLSRGKMIARTERGLAINMGRMEGYRQGAAKAGIPLEALRKTWIHRGSHIHERLHHVALSYAPARPFTEPFVSNGFACQMPHDPALPASEVISCDCEVKVTVPRNWRAWRG